MSLKNKNTSPFRIALKSLLGNRLAFIGLLTIVMYLLIAILGPTIRIDKTPKANQQYLELSRQPPGFSVDMLLLENKDYLEVSFLKGWLFGIPSKYIKLPIYSQKKLANQFVVERYTGNTPNAGEVLTFQLEEVIGVERENFPLGTDRYGRDMLSRLMAGVWVSFFVGLVSIVISLSIGVTLGAIAGYYGAKVDEFIVWLINVVWSIPTLLLVIAMTLALGKGIWQVFVAVGLTMWVEVARVVRGQILSTKQKEFVEAGKAFGFKNARIIWKHILPNIMGPIIVISASNFAAAILIEAGLSFLGLGAQPPQATWGKMISEHKGYIITGDAYLAILPGIAICSLVLSFVLVGNGLRDAFDIKRTRSLTV